MEFKASLGGGSKAGGGGGGEEGWNGGKGRTAEGNSIRRYERCGEGERRRGNGVIEAKKIGALGGGDAEEMVLLVVVVVEECGTGLVRGVGGRGRRGKVAGGEGICS